MTLESKVVMVTGGGSGIGQSCVALLLAQRARIIVFDRTAPPSPPQDRRGEPGLLYIQGDVKSASDIARAVDQGCAAFGRLDVGINCAGITGPLAPLADQPDDAIDEVWAINVRGIFLSMKYQIRVMLRQKSGSIVNAASVFSHRTMNAFGLYIASKHAVAGLTKTAAIEVADRGIRVNAVAPGPIRTPFIGELDDVREREAAATVPMLRLGEPDEVARAILWLASDEATYLTGTILSVDGGMGANKIA